MTVLVVGATGELGTAVVRTLVRSGRDVRAFVRPDSTHDHLVGDRVSLVHGDLRDPASVDRALVGVSAVVATASSVIPRGAYRIEDVEGRGYRHLIDASVAACVGRFVLGSVPPTPFDALAPAFALKHEAEAHLRASGLVHTIVQPSLFMESWLALIGSRIPLAGSEVPTLRRPYWFSQGFMAVVGGLIEQRGLAVIPGNGRARHAFVTVGDVARFLVGSLDAPVARNATLQVGGPEVFDWFEVTELFGRVIGRRVRTVHTPSWVFRMQSAFLRPFAPAAANLMTLNRIAACVDTPFASSALAADLGFELTRVETFLRGKVASSALAVAAK
jgi:uncharacterized protein YbjT (DUF2867 family)